MNDKTLNARERSFVRAFTSEARGNGTRAAVLAGYSPRTARIQASQLLTKLNIQRAVQERSNRADRKATADAHERDVMLTSIIRDQRIPVDQRIKAIAEMNKCEGRHIARHQLAGRITLEEALGASQTLE